MVVNYFTCVVLGGLLFRGFDLELFSDLQDWYVLAIIQGFLLITCFFLMAWTTQKVGVVESALASRLSVVIPIAFAFFLFNEQVGWRKLLGIVLALMALYFSTVDRGRPKGFLSPQHLVLPISLFIGFGLHLTFTKYAQACCLTGTTFHVYVMSMFAVALLFGAFALVWRVTAGKVKIRFKDVAGGLILGINNYGAIYFLLRTLAQPGWDSSVVFPVISVAVVCFGVLGGRLFFGEILSTRKLGALAAGVLAIAILN